MANLGKLVHEAVTLSTPQGRLTAWLLLSVIIFLSPFHWLGNLSVWQRIGWDSAPSIGLTRAYWLLLHGDIDAALQRNRLILPIVVIGLAMLSVDALRIARGRQRSSKDLH